tara:strand:- start:10346 stop:10915 length:570 start_codon:yes stop_codon:yes gene_type:complete
MIKKGETIINARSGQKMTFTSTWLETNGTQLSIDCVSPPSNTREKMHIHPHQENRFTIRSGELIFTIDGKLVRAVSGDVISIPKNIPHTFHNESDTDAHYIQDFFPALRIDSLFETFFVLAEQGKLNKNGSPNILRIALILLHFQKEIKLSSPSWVPQKTLFKLLSPFAKALGYKAFYERKESIFNHQN